MCEPISRYVHSDLHSDLHPELHPVFAVVVLLNLR